ncbi:MAG: FG-GAP-like repeat-containing protein [Bifidobacteriaceae bacterium]|nr:FG-GAP-like repeat-containing protein [Bifidobacteriaceae bacterium]
MTTNYTASWENHNMVNAASNPTSSNPGTGQGWGNWSNGASSSNPAWIQYRWDEPISITSTQIYWYSDGGGTRVPTAAGYTIQYSMDGTTWTNVTLTNGSTYAAGIQTGRYNVFEIEPVTAKYLRIRITAITSSAAGTGVLRWRVYGPGVETVEPPIKHRTAVGVIPTLPATHGVTFTDGSRGELVFEWADITADDVAEANTDPFSVWGVNTTFDVMAEAQIYVRPGDQQVVISSIDPMAQTVFLGTEPDLPENLSVFFNDGSADNDCIGVTWDYDPAVVNTVGVYHIPGHYTLPDWISETNQPDVFFDLTVEGPEVLSVDVTPVAPTVVAGNTQQFTEDVDTTYDADDSVTWTVEGAESFITAIDATGLLSVGTDETATTLVVKATSVFDPTKVGTATVTVTPAPPDDALAAALAQAKALLPAADSYTVSSWTGFPQTVDDADAVCYVVTGTTGPCDTADPPVSAADKWAAIADLHDAIAGLVPRGDPSSLGTVVDILGNLDLSAYTEDSQEALQDAIEAIENLLAQNPADVSQEQVDQVKQQLADAIAGLELEITPSTSLETVLDAVSAMDLSGFTPESAQALEEALADAQAVLDSNPTQAEVDAAMQAVADALAGLVPAVDKSALVSLIDANAAIYAAGNGAAIYTDASWAVFAAAIEAASDEYDSTTSTTQSVADAYAILVAAVAGLVEIGQVVPGTVTISGTVKVGQTVTVAPGTWTPADAQLSYQWKLDGTDIAGAVTTSYAIKAGDEGKTLTVAVTGIKADHVDGSTTSAGVLIGLGDLTAGTPTISGTVKVGQSVTATPGTWGPSGVALGYQWKLGGTAISGAVTSTYAIKAADAGKTLTVTVTGSKAGYAAASATSAGQVVAAAPTPTATPTPSKSATPTPTAAATKTATPTPAGPKAYVPKYQSFVLSPDLAADGRGEILAVTTAGALEIHSANAAGGIASSKTVFSSGFAGTKVYGPGDWNGDGKADVVAVDKSGYMWLYAGDGKGGLAAKKEIGHGWTPFRIIPAGDLNQDGANDLLAIDASGKLWLYAGNGKGGFKGSPTQVGQGWNGIDLYAAGDLNGDGKNDILALLPDSTLWAYSGRGNGTFATPTQVGRGWGQFELAAGADLNGDRRADIVGRNNSTGELFYYQGNGGGSFQAAKKIASGW